MPGVVDAVPEVVETVTETVGDVVDTVGDVVDALDQGVDTVAGVVDDTVGAVSGLLGGLFGRAASAAEELPVDAGQTADDLVDGTGSLLSSAEEANSLQNVAQEAGTGGDDEVRGGVEGTSLSSAPVESDLAGDDGFLDTLLSADGADALLDAAPDDLFEGLLGSEDTFGLDVVPTPLASDDDLSAGLSGDANLSGSLADQVLLEPSGQNDTAGADEETDGLLNDILAGGVDDILGQESDFDSLLGETSAVEDDTPASEAPTAALFEDSVVEGALGVLFGHAPSSDGGLLDGLSNGWDSDEPS